MSYFGSELSINHSMARR